MAARPSPALQAFIPGFGRRLLEFPEQEDRLHQPATRQGGHIFFGRWTIAKSDYLAAANHLAAWSERNRLHQEQLQSRLQDAALPCDMSASIQIAKWVYQQTERANGQVWVKEKVLKH